jgi:ribosome-binding factor A
VSFHKTTRGRKPRRGGDVWPGENQSPEQYFGEPDRAEKKNWKTEQLCRQVERAVAMVVAESAEDALLGAAVAFVEPWPDAARLRITVVLGAGTPTEQVQAARQALTRAAGMFRVEVARSIHRKRVPEIAFQVMLAYGKES